MNRKITYSAVIALAVVFSLASFAAMAKNGNAQNDKSNKSSNSQGKKDTTAELKNFEKANETKGGTNAQVHKDKSEEVAKKLEEAANGEKAKGNKEVGEQIEAVAAEEEQAQEDTSKAIEEVESRGKVKTFLLGTDYKNLGQLRSSLVHNRNQIRTLTRTMAQAQTEEGKALIEAQLVTMAQERERIKSVITANESSFSLFGWVSRFLNDYEQAPINEQEETELENEVEEAIGNATTPVVPATTPAQ